MNFFYNIVTVVILHWINKIIKSFCYSFTVDLIYYISYDRLCHSKNEIQIGLKCQYKLDFLYLYLQILAINNLS